jgi:hypothetical protein
MRQAKTVRDAEKPPSSPSARAVLQAELTRLEADWRKGAISSQEYASTKRAVDSITKG